eukprot:scaffold287726_cov35-Tisochrysis_lutea.AAC.1
MMSPCGRAESPLCSAATGLPPGNGSTECEIEISLLEPAPSPELPAPSTALVAQSLIQAGAKLGPHCALCKEAAAPLAAGRPCAAADMGVIRLADPAHSPWGRSDGLSFEIIASISSDGPASIAGGCACHCSLYSREAVAGEPAGCLNMLTI